MEEIKLFDGKIAKVLKIEGYDDGYYWDMSATVEIDGKQYVICDAGSGSGYIPAFESMRLNEAFKLTGAEMKDIDTFDSSSKEYIEKCITSIYKKFVTLGAKEDYECAEINDYKYDSGCECMVDGEIVKGGWELGN